MNIKNKISEIAAREQRLQKHYDDVTDVVVIGSGIGGLSAGALLSQFGIKTHVIEKNDHVGGYYSYFTHEDCIFDYAISYVLSLNSDGEATKFLKKLGIEDKIDVMRLNSLDKYIFPDGSSYTIPADEEQFIKDMQEKFPDEKEHITEVFDWLNKYDQGLKNVNKRPSMFIIKNFLRDFEPFIKSSITNQDLINILSIRIQAYPPSLFIMGGFLNECLLHGMYYIKGGSFNLALTLAEYINEHGGAVSLKNSVEQIVYNGEDEYCYTVITSSGEKIKTKYIVSDTSPQNILSMLDDRDGCIKDKIDKFKLKVSKRKVGHSSINVFLKVQDVDLSSFNCGRIYILPEYEDKFDIFDYYNKLEDGTYFKKPLLKVHIPTVYDDTLADEGVSIIRVETDMCNDYFRKFKDDFENNASNEEYEAEKKRILSYVVERLDCALKTDIKSHVLYSRVLTPLDFEKITCNTNGSGTGWAHTVKNYFKDIFTTKTILPNCFIVGQWGELGSGLRQLIVSGTRAADQISELMQKK